MVGEALSVTSQLLSGLPGQLGLPRRQFGREQSKHTPKGGLFVHSLKLCDLALQYEQYFG